MPFEPLSTDLQQRLQAELQPGETLAWAGQPDPDRMMRSGLAIWLFFVPWTAFALFWTAAASRFTLPRLDEGGWNLFPLFGLPFVLIGLWGLAQPLRLRSAARHMVYALTSRRAITISGTRSITVQSYLLADLKDLERKEHADGSGDLVFAEEVSQSARSRRVTRQGFIAVPNVRQVQRRIEQLLQAA